MKRRYYWSVILLSISSLGGSFRGLRMISKNWDFPIIFPFPEDKLQDSLFSNYQVLGVILLCTVGIFSIISLILTIRRSRIFPYMLIIEGIFILFLALTHMLYAGATIPHVFVIALAVTQIILGIQQSPREF